MASKPKRKGGNMGNIEDLKAELKGLQEKREEATKIKQLKKAIKLEKFGQTKGGKVFNAIGDAGLKVMKKIGTQPKGSEKAGKKKAVKNIKDIMASLPQ